jgi:hypothetical protein
MVKVQDKSMNKYSFYGIDNTKSPAGRPLGVILSRPYTTINYNNINIINIHIIEHDLHLQKREKNGKRRKKKVFGNSKRQKKSKNKFIFLQK